MNYLRLIDEKNKKELASFIYYRLHSRYIKPLCNDEEDEENYNGFSIMANCCLLIETIESFKQGIGDTSGNSKKMFVDFFKSETNFKLFEKKTDLFYSKVRCGILHQGETTGGWILLRKGKQLFDSENLKISPKKFLDEIEISLKKYKSLLENEDWDSEIWDNFRRKMRIIIKNCQK